MIAQRGFTLVELMLALAMTALIGATAYAALDGVFRSRLVYQERSEQLAQLQRFLTVIGRDIQQAAGVQNRGPDGDYEETLIVSPGDENVLTLNRRGWHNPLLAERSELQRVYYRFDGEILIRGHWEAFDRTEDTPFRERVVLEQVTEIIVRALPDSEGGNLDRLWQEQWPQGEGGLPAALELSVETEYLGRIKRIYELLPQG